MFLLDLMSLPSNLGPMAIHRNLILAVPYRMVMLLRTFSFF